MHTGGLGAKAATVRHESFVASRFSDRLVSMCRSLLSQRRLLWGWKGDAKTRGHTEGP